jgi:hypothetical protein
VCVAKNSAQLREATDTPWERVENDKVDFFEIGKIEKKNCIGPASVFESPSLIAVVHCIYGAHRNP